MGIENQTKQIGEFTFEVIPLGAKAADKVLLKIAKSVGPVFLLAAGGGGVAGAAEALEKLSETDFEYVRDTLAASTNVLLPDGKKPRLSAVYDVLLTGMTDERVEWLEWAIEVNFGPFFRGLKRKAEERMRAPEAARASSSSSSPTT